MNFLEICRTVNTLSGIQGVIEDTATAIGIQATIVQCVSSGWVQIQNYRKDWEFMIDKVSFATVAGKEIYTPAEVFASHPDGENLGHYLKGRIMLDYRPLAYASPYQYPFIQNTSQRQPTWFAIEPSDNRLYLELPNDIYIITPYYYKRPQELSASTDIPDIPEQFHKILIYKGLELLGVHIGNQELYQKYSTEHNQLLGVLMRNFIPHKKILLNGGIA